MSNQLIPTSQQKTDISEALSGSFLPRVQLFGANSKAVKSEQIAMAHYGLVNDQAITDLGKEVDVLVICWRPKAMRIEDDNSIVVTHDMKSELYAQIKAESAKKDSGCMYGPEFLLFVPEHNFATFFLSSKTARREGRRFEQLLGCAATLKSKLIEQGTYAWHGPVVVPCDHSLDIPDYETVIVPEMDKFQNPPDSGIEVAQTSERVR